MNREIVSQNRLLRTSEGTTQNTYTYDGQHRRVSKKTFVGNRLTASTHFIYDGWNVIEEWTTDLQSTTTTLAKTHTWGTDLSGSLQGAGGVGGLLLTEEPGSQATTAYHFHYDGNGNVTEITDLTGTPAASYRYDAFGNTLVATGSYAEENKYRFSTKPLDAEITTAPLYYYGYRYYDPQTGRWPSRDPIEEMGGLNLYGFVGNDGVNKWDILGMVEVDPAEIPDPVKAPVVWVNKPRIQNPGLSLNTGIVVCSCKESDVGKISIICSVIASSTITLNQGAKLKADETFEGVYGHEQLHVKLFASEVTKLVAALKAESDDPATAKRAMELEEKYKKIMEEARKKAQEHDEDGDSNNPRPVEGKPYNPLSGSPPLPPRQ